MRIVAALLLLVAILGCSARPPVTGFGPGTETLVERERELNQAFAERDGKRINALLAPEYVFHFIDHNMSGALQATPNAPRGRWLDAMFAPLSNGPLQTSVIDARINGSMGVVVSYYKWSGSWNGKGFEYEGHVTDIWIYRFGRWQVLSSTADLLPPYR